MVNNDTRRASRPWAELPADVLREIAGHLHDAADFVHFHAVCTPWRAAPALPHAPRFLPCLIVEGDSTFDDRGMHLHSPFSTKIRYTPSFRALAALRGKLLEFSDAAGGRVLAVGWCEGDRTAVLINPLDGDDATSLPPLPQNISPIDVWQSISGIACNNGVVTFYTRVGGRLAVFLWRPGETDWEEEVDVTCPLEILDEHTRQAAMLCSSSVLSRATCTMAELPCKRVGMRRCIYVLECQGKLLCLDVLDMSPCLRQRADELALMTVHTLEVRDDGRPQWVKMEHGRGAEHVCLFLNWATSSGFAIDAREFASTEVTGGCAYFVDMHPKWTMRLESRRELYAVYRYSFKDGTAAVVDELPACFDRKAMRYTPRPRLSLLRSQCTP